MKVVEVIFPGLPKSLSYSAEKEVGVGWQVRCKIKSSLRRGWVTAVNQADHFKSSQASFLSENDGLKPVQDAVPAFHPENLKIFHEISEYYGVSLGETLESCLPNISSVKTNRSYVFANKIPGSSEPSGTKQKEAYQSLSSQPSLVKKSPQLKKLVEKEIIECAPASESEVYHHKLTGRMAAIPEQSWPALNKDQQQAVHNFKNLDQHSSSLLFGITGSGKTEVYLHLINRVMTSGKGVLVLVPEIALTPQLTDRIENRLRTPLAVLHSGVSKAEKCAAWSSIYEGQTKLVLGARSAVFAPIKELGLIIIDEEHDSSYKQGDGIRYDARLIAALRAAHGNCPILVGSATPSFETLYGAKKNGVNVLELPERANRQPLPEIELVDMRKVRKKDMPSPSISPALHEEISTALSQGNQVAILYNRRGYSSFLQCNTCGEAVKCPNCTSSLTYHKKNHSVLCHLCGYSEKCPSTCSTCIKPAFQEQTEEVEIGKLDAIGAGTEKVHEEIQELFSDAKIVRLDRDTVVSRQRMLDALGMMHSGEADILIGTQMIAKGHDLPNVSLVGILNPDVGLHVPDFRSSERTLQLISQAAGRSGRGEVLGKVVIQTREPDHPTMVAATNHRFKAFVRHELMERKACFYPPYTEMLRVVISNQDLRRAESCSQSLIFEVKELIAPKFCEDREEVVIYGGPARCAYEKVNNMYRWHFTVRTADKDKIKEIAKFVNLKKRTKDYRDTRITVDVGAIDLL